MPDRWAAWLAERRFGGDAAAARESQALFDEFRRRVLEGARIGHGDVVLDVGCGEGLIGLGALELVGENGRVIFSDVSDDVLAVCRANAAGDPRCEFVRASADALPLDDAAVDVVTTRSVVIYLEDKPATLRGCYGASTLVGWDERDLLRWIEDAGFADVELTVGLGVKPHPIMHMSWDAFLHFAPNPLAPTLQEAMDERLTPEEQERLVAHLRPRVERGEGSARFASAYIRARKT